MCHCPDTDIDPRRLRHQNSFKRLLFIMHMDKVFVKYIKKILFQCLLLIIIMCFCILAYDSSMLYLKSIVIKEKYYW